MAKQLTEQELRQQGVRALSDNLGPVGALREVTIPTGSKVSGVVLADQVKSLDWRFRKAEFVCKLPRETTNEVLDKLGTLLIDGS